MTVSVRLVLIDAAPTHSSPIPGQSFVDRHERAKGNGLLAIQYYGCCVVDSYHEERNHQGKDNRILFPSRLEARRNLGAVRCRERLGGLLKYYKRASRA